MSYQYCKLSDVMKKISLYEEGEKGHQPLSKETLDYFTGGYIPPTEEEMTGFFNKAIRYTSDRLTVIISKDWKPW
jgi:hypothetical protein